METVCFVILHYKDKKLTDTCVQSILRMEGQERIRIVILDNDVEKEEQERKKLSEAYRSNPRIVILTVLENGGFSYANNQGYRYCREQLNASCIIMLNNDIQFTQKDFLKRLEESLQTYPCYVLGPDIICQRNGDHQNPMDTHVRTKREATYTVRMNRLACRLYPVIYPVLYWKLKKENERKSRQKKENETFYRQVQKRIVPFGACLIFSPIFVRKVELPFIPETRFFYEEYILAYRCRKNGWRIVYDPSIQVLHENGAATKKTFKNERKRLRFMLERMAQAGEVYLDMISEDELCVEKSKR